jgi:hypothetical protein
MLALGATPEQMGTMHIDHIFKARLRLLMIMLKAYLQGYPIGRYRVEGIIRNAQIVGDEVVDLWHQSRRVHNRSSAMEEFQIDHEVYEHIKTLALFAEKMESDKKPDKAAMEFLRLHLDDLNQSLLPNRNLSEMRFLKVA